MHIKRTYLCREINEYSIEENIPQDYVPKVGDVGVFEIIKIGKHRTVQGDTKRNVLIIPGDVIMAAFGNRYATGQFEGYIPQSLQEDIHVLGAGGVVGLVKSMHAHYLEIGPTIIRPKGLVKDASGNIINTKTEKQSLMVPFTGENAAKTKVILSLGSAMDSGKSTTASYLVNGIKRAGHSVAFIKLTGTTYTKDTDLNMDLVADVIADFSDFGNPSTYLCGEQEMLDLFESLLKKVNVANPEYVVMEIADGLYQKETKMLYQHPVFIKSVHAVVFSAGDSLSAMHGVELLMKAGIQPLALCGLFTTSPLLVNEVKENLQVDLPVVTIEEISMHAEAIINRRYVAATEVV